MKKISLKALRVDMDMTQEDAAKELGITVRTLQNWESGETFPTVKQLMQLCEVYQCEVADVRLPVKLAESEQGA